MPETIRRRPKAEFELNSHSNCGPFIFVGGIIGDDPGQKGHIDGDIALQTGRALNNLTQKLKILNAEFGNVVSTSVYLKRAQDFAAMNEIYRCYWPVNPPTRTTIVADLRHPEALIEVSAMVSQGDQPRDIVKPQLWQPSPNPYSYGIISGRTFFMSGLVPRNPHDQSLVTGDIKTQTRAVLENAKELLKTANLTFKNVVSSRIYIRNASDFEAMHAVYRTYFPMDPPACTTGVTELMNPEFLVEITLNAIKDKYRMIMPPLPEHGSVHLSSFVQAEGRLFVSGMRGESPETRHNTSTQTLESMQRLARLLKRARFSWRELREILIYVADINDVPAVLYEIAPFLPVYRRPTGNIVQMNLLQPGARVEISGSFARDRWRWR
jgi:enamine deaminase RidA (YjgF/YER057c/UK114 family)